MHCSLTKIVIKKVSMTNFIFGNTYFVTTQSHAKIDMLCTTLQYQLLHKTYTMLNVIVFCHMTAIMCSTSFEFWHYQICGNVYVCSSFIEL